MYKYIYIILAFLFIPALNLSGMISSRMNSRLAELGVRKAYGATNAQILWQLLWENLFLTFLGRPYLTEKGIETIKSNLAQEIFRQDLLQIYQKQTDIRDELRQESRDRITEIVDAINHGNFDDPQMQMMLMQLADRLAKSKGKKQYGYLNAGTKKIVDEIVRGLSSDSRIQELYSLWYEQGEDVLRTYTNKMPERIPLEQQKEFKTIRNAVVQVAMQLHIPQEELPLSDPVPPRVDFPDDGSEVYTKAVEILAVPEVEPSSEVKQFLHETAIRGSVDAVYGVGKQYMKTDIQKAISMFELAAEQGNSYAEYQLGKIYCFGQGVPKTSKQV